MHYGRHLFISERGNITKALLKTAQRQLEDSLKTSWSWRQLEVSLTMDRRTGRLI